ncbi:MAG: hypothetical protein QOF89_1673 [Acidobacteriota bacterium]|jgi:CHAT domain-containing protein/tetratricopeptide (TPR) repeat protein|nr:hypothetical protein [Acidobacteriota bacterium]
MANQEDIQQQAYALLIQGQQLLEAGKPEEAAGALLRSLELLHSIRDLEGEMGVRILLGTALMASGRLQEAHRSVRAALALAREIGEPGAEHPALLFLGQLSIRTGHLEEAHNLLEQSLGLARRIQEPTAEYQSLIGLGLCSREQGYYLSALRSFERAVHLSRQQGDPGEEAHALTHLGTLLHYMGDFSRSIEQHQRAVEILRRLGDHRGLGGVLSELGRACLVAGEPEQARRYSEEALEITRQTGDLITQGYALAHLARIAMMSGDYPLALRTLNESLSLKEKTGDLTGTAASLASKSMVHMAMGSCGEALAVADRALNLARALGAPEAIGMALTGLGIIRHHCGDLPGAERALRESLDFLESIRLRLEEEDRWQISLSDRHFGTYRYLQEVLVARGKAGPALEIAERGRAQALAQLMVGRLSSGASPVEPPHLAELQRIAREQEATLVEYTLLVDPFMVILGPGAGAEEYRYRYLIWVIRPDGEVAVRRKEGKIEKSDFEEEPSQERLRELDGVKAYWRQPRSEHAAYRVFIEPIESLLPSEPGARLVLIPQDSLGFVPWAAIEDRAGVPLIERYSISFSPSIQTLDLARRRKAQLVRGTAEALVVGDPAFAAGSGLPRLEGAADEARTIADLLGTRPLLGPQATKATVLRLMPDRRILHFATHGLLGEVDSGEIPGAIAFAPSGPGDDGLLTAAEIMRLDLNAELVVLSACQTGRGRESNDSVIGLSRAFLAAGVPSLIVSLWPVPDGPTAFLMKEFYQALNRGFGKAQALREAMLATRRLVDPNPRSWAGFALLGESA